MKTIGGNRTIAKIVTYLLLGAGALTLGSYAGADEDTPATTSTDTSGGAKLEEVVVSARRVREAAQDVPISITALTQGNLDRQDIRSATDLQQDIPGLTICCGPGQADYNFLRGIQGVQSYFAETPMLAYNGVTALSGNALYFDLENVSVLKGPQGTLFGMSTNGGALLFAPHKAVDDFEGYVSAEGGNYGRRIVEGVVNLPVSSVLSIRVGGQSAYIDGYVTDITSGVKLGTQDYTVGRIAVRFHPTDGFENNLYVNEYNAGGTLAPYVPVAVNPNGAARATIGPALDTYIARQIALGYYELVGSSLPAADENRNTVRQTNIANITSFELSDALTLRNIFGYEREYDWTQFDADGTPYAIYDNNVPGSTPTGTNTLVTEEFQAQGLTLNKNLNYTAGLFFAHSKPGSTGTEIASLVDAYGIETSTSASPKFQTEAAYGQATYNLGDWVQGLKFTAGYRYTIDRRWLYQTSATIIPAYGLTLPNPPLNLYSDAKDGSYTLGLTYEAKPGVMYYLTNSKGFLNGGFNTSVTNPAEAPYAPESLNNIELGVKAESKIGDMSYRSNLAVYYGFYDNAQVSVTTVINPGTPQQALAVLTENAAKGRVRGAEWDLRLIPITQFEVGLFGSYMDNKYTQYNSLNAVGQPVDLDNTPFVYTPKWKYGLTGRVYMLSNDKVGDLNLAAIYTHQSSVVTTAVVNPPWYDQQPGFGNLDLSLEWNNLMGRHNLDALLFVRNATQNRDSNGGFGAYPSLGILGYTPAIPRMVGIRLKQAF